VKGGHVPAVFHLNLILLSFLVQFFIVLSCLISVSVNFSTFLVIGKTSPVTYQVLGHLKTCLVLTFGYVLLHDPFSWRNILGILIAIVGMVLYSYFCTVETQQKSVEAAPQQVFFCLNFNLCWTKFYFSTFLLLHLRYERS
jgi:drug/metabolite transporter (DMT)-like permease